MKILGMDIGDKRIGIAITDKDKKLSIPLAVIDNDRFFEQNLDKILEENIIEKIVVGMPYTLKGEIGKQGKKVIDFVDKNIVNNGIEIIYMDERFTSKIPIKTSVNKKKIKKQIDKYSAVLILQNYLDRISRINK
ncbi:MAG TPA: Holliday junction resolvase RuvX [Actinobacteria bacterium]|nr:Holliday junction resolvase RuvX [Actinomycetota bacterium]